MVEKPPEQGRMGRVDEAGAGYELERKFYQELLQVVQKWERSFAALEEREQRRVVSEATKSGLLQAIQMARAVVDRYEQNQRDD